MSDISPYPRESPPAKRSRVVALDRLIALLSGAYALTAFGSAFVIRPSLEYLVLLPFALIPAALLLIPKFGSMFTVALLSFPCFFASFAYADVAQGLPTLSDKLLYNYAPFNLVIGAYALIRTVHIGIVNMRSKKWQV